MDIRLVQPLLGLANLSKMLWNQTVPAEERIQELLEQGPQSDKE